MSVKDSTDSTKHTEPYQSGESCSKSEEKQLSFLRLEQLGITSFQWENVTPYMVRYAPAEVFDAFIAEVVEQIINVDRAIWPDFDRWNVVNECLAEDVLTLNMLPDGSLELTIPEVEDQDQEERITTEPLSSEQEGQNDAITES